MPDIGRRWIEVSRTFYLLINLQDLKNRLGAASINPYSTDNSLFNKAIGLREIFLWTKLVSTRTTIN